MLLLELKKEIYFPNQVFQIWVIWQSDKIVSFYITMARRLLMLLLLSTTYFEKILQILNTQCFFLHPLWDSAPILY